MKIVFLSDDFPPLSFGGAGISTYELALGMKQAGHTVFVITTCRKDTEAGETNYNGLTVIKIQSDYSARWRAYVSLYNRPVVVRVEKLFQKIQPDVVHINNIHYYLSYHCLKVASRYTKVVVFTARDVMTFNFSKLETKQYLEFFNSKTTWRDHVRQAQKRWNPIRNFCIRRYLRFADRIFAISKSLQDAMKQNSIGNVGVIYNGIDIRDWVIELEEVTKFKMKYHLLGKKVLFFGGRLSASKGGVKVIEALADIVKEVPDTLLLVAGGIDEYGQKMKKYACDFGVEDKIIFTGWIGREEIKNAYAASDVVLMPSLCLDTFGRVNIEAMASRKPVVGTRYGGTPEVVEDGVTGYIVDPRNSDEIAQKSIELLKNPGKAIKFGATGYERVQKCFKLEDKVREYIMAYESILTEKKHL